MANFLTKLDFYFRIIVLITALTFGVMFILINGKQALAANLRSHVTITDSVLKLGDIFDGLSAEKAAYVLGPAPLPGNDMVLNARTLMRIAIALELPWQPQHSLEQVVLTRAATLIDKTQIKNTLHDALSAENAGESFDILFRTTITDMVLPQDVAPTIEVTDISFDPRNGTFEATLSAPSAAHPLQTQAVAGQIERLVTVPVLKNTVTAGRIIGSDDIDWTEIPARTVQSGTMMKAEDLIGMTPRRLVVPGKPLRDQELEYPQVISRGETVTIVYESGPITLTAKGRALQSGARGDNVRVVNDSSNRTIEASVHGDGEVRVLN